MRVIRQINQVITTLWYSKMLQEQRDKQPAIPEEVWEGYTEEVMHILFLSFVPRTSKDSDPQTFRFQDTIMRLKIEDPKDLSIM